MIALFTKKYFVEVTSFLIPLKFEFHDISTKTCCEIFHVKVMLAVIWLSQLTITCPNLTIETLEQGIKYVQS